jgi:hypothetical protein
MPKKSSKKIKMSQKQKQTTKQSVVVNVRNVINERRRRPAPKPKPKEVRDTVTLQPRSSFLGNNLMMGNVSRYVQPAMAFAVNPPQLPMQQTAVVDKPLGKPIEPKQRPDIFDGVEVNPFDIEPIYTPEPKGKPILPKSSLPEAIKQMTRDMLFRQIELYGVKPPRSTKKEELQAILQSLIEDQPLTPSASSSSASASGPLQVTPSSIRFLETLNVAPRPPPRATSPEEEKGPAQAFGGPPRGMQEVIAMSPKEVTNLLEQTSGKSPEEVQQAIAKIMSEPLPKYSQKDVLKILRELSKS